VKELGPFDPNPESVSVDLGVEVPRLKSELVFMTSGRYRMTHFPRRDAHSRA
jgi:hypothetical protein